LLTLIIILLGLAKFKGLKLTRRTSTINFYALGHSPAIILLVALPSFLNIYIFALSEFTICSNGHCKLVRWEGSVFGSWPDPYNTNDVKNLHNAFSYGTVHKEFE
jgi:hypothetical protein